MTLAKLLVAFFFCFTLVAQPRADQAVRILTQNCGACHSAGAHMSGLEISSREALLRGGSRGPAISADARSSRLIQFVRHSAPPFMPPGKQLTPEQIAVLEQWIDAGAAWPDESSAPVRTAAPWWSFVRPSPPAPPATSDHWVRSPVDAFILKTLRARNLSPAPEASRADWLRRVYFDLTGLPPVHAEVKAFEDDHSPDAHERVVDRLLASPRYGERMARDWLDLVRYADTAGFELDPYNADAWRYRDWVIQSFNDDKPYDRFVREQLAGDELAPGDPVAKTGTGYFCVGPNRDFYPDQQDINRVETLTDYVDTTSAVFLGLTVSCARCHDHKFDPIPQRDYYRLQAIFEPAHKTRISLGKLPGLSYDVAANVREMKLLELSDQLAAVQSPCRNQAREMRLAKLPEAVRAAMRLDEGQRTPEQDELIRKNESLARVTDEDIRACLTPEQRERLTSIEKQLVSMFANYKPKPYACGVEEPGPVATATFVPARGGGPGLPVQPGLLSALGGIDIPDAAPTATSTGRRKALAGWIASPDNPLTARVIVNRLWQHHFGRGLVATPSDFGVRGAAPSHPELLDWLATEFVARGWSLKQIHRIIVLSSVYRQSTKASTEAAAHDPENVYLSYFNRRRLSAEELRDAVLQSSGALNLKMFGRPVVPALNPLELYGLTGKTDDAWIITQDAHEQNRRSIYLFARRTYRIPMMEVFDLPDSMMTCPRREASTTAPQSLTMLNGEFAVRSARLLATSLRKADTDDRALAGAAWRAVLAREPSDTEFGDAAGFLDRQRKNLASPEASAAELTRALFNLNEFLYVN